MKEQIQELYAVGLEKYAGDEEAAKAFVSGFLKEAFFGPVVNVTNGMNHQLGHVIAEGGAKALGMGAAGLALGLGIHGISSAMNSAGNLGMREKFQKVLASVVNSNPVLMNADREKINQFAETIFKFAPKVATDPNLLTNVLVNAAHGEAGLDTTTIRALVDLESKVQETRKNALFSPKPYV